MSDRSVIRKLDQVAGDGTRVEVDLEARYVVDDDGSRVEIDLEARYLADDDGTRVEIDLEARYVVGRGRDPPASAHTRGLGLRSTPPRS